MITFLLGLPGSGKSYYAVDKIYNNFSTDKEAIKDKKSTFEICYTNINEFNFDKVENCHYLDFDEFKNQLKKLHELYKSKATDEELIEVCKEYDILNALFVIDEAHNFFDTRDTVLVWWLSYHRHLYHEIILITQNLALIESKYKSFSEFFYKAFPQSLTLFKTHFKYNIYCNSRMSQTSKSGSIKIKRNPKVFDLYKSGDSINSSNIILKILFFTFLLFILLVVLFYFYSNSLKTNEPKEPKKTPAPMIVTKTLLPAPSTPEPVNEEFSQKRFFVLNCSASICVNEAISIPLQLLNKFIGSKDITSLYVYPLSKSFTRHYLQSNEDFYTFLSQTKGSNNDISLPDNSLLGSATPTR